MRIQRIGFIVFLFLVLVLSLSLAQNETLNNETVEIEESLNENLTGEIILEEENVTEELNTISLELTKTKYLSGDILEGNVRLFLKGPIDPNMRVQVKVLGSVKTLSLSQALTNASKNFTLLSGVLNKTNPALSKKLFFSQTGSQLIGVLLPGYSEVQSISMNIKGPGNNALRVPRLDIGNDGTIDWYYLGELTGFMNEESKPLGLQDALPGSTAFIKDNTTLFCQNIVLPFGRHYKILADYKKVAAVGDLRAMMLAPFAGDFSFPQGGADMCDLPEGTSFGYKECLQPIELQYAAKGNQLVCILNAQNDSEGNEYELKSDNSELTTTAYNCQGTIEGYGCSKVTQNDFFIKVKGATYNDVLSSSIDFNLFDLGPNSVKIALRKYVGSSDSENPLLNFVTPICGDQKCLVPIKVFANDSGEITFSNLTLNYDFEGVSQQESLFYDVIEETPLINGVEKKSLDAGVEVLLPLHIFNLIAPTLPTTTAPYISVTMDAALDGKYTKAPLEFQVYETEIPPDASRKLLDDAKETFATLLTGDEDRQALVDILGLRSSLTTAQQSLAQFESEYTNDGESEALQQKILAALSSVPRLVQVENGLTDIQLIEPQDITEKIADDPDDAYFMQNKIIVKYTIKSYLLEDFSGVQMRKQLVVKEITAKEKLESFNVFEVIPKSYAYSVSEIKFEQPPDIVEDDPIVKWFVQSLNANAKRTFRYVLDTSQPPGDTLKTIIVSLPLEEGEEEPDSVCGDNVCTTPLEDATVCPEDCKKPFPWFTVILIIVLALALGSGIWIFKDKFISLTRGKTPFKTQKDLKVLTQFIKKARKAGKKDSEIQKLLVDKGWTVKHIAYAIEEITLQRVHKDVDLKPMKAYIAASLQKGASREEIKKKLLSQGWDLEVVEKELKK